MESPKKYAWQNNIGGLWVVYNLRTTNLEIMRCSVSENPQSLPHPPTGIAILWVPPGITDELALQRASHSPIYHSLLSPDCVKHVRSESLTESESKRAKNDGIVSPQTEIDSSSKKRRQE
jgi:hypothetical protein